MLFLQSAFSFSPPNAYPHRFSPALVTSTALAIAAGVSGTVLLYCKPSVSFLKPLESSRPSFLSWASIALSGDSPPIIQPDSSDPFPEIINDSLNLLGIGLRKKSIMGLKNIDIYSYGVYANESQIKESQSAESSSKSKKAIIDYLMEADTYLTIRLQIIYGRLSVRSVRSAFEESVGHRLQKLGGSDDREMLQRFISQFRDEYRIPKGSVIDIKREPGHVLRTAIDGNEIGSIESKILCKSILDLYIGDDPFDQQAKEAIELRLANLISS